MLRYVKHEAVLGDPDSIPCWDVLRDHRSLGFIQRSGGDGPVVFASQEGLPSLVLQEMREIVKHMEHIEEGRA